jgi:hypothetical protein
MEPNPFNETMPEDTEPLLNTKNADALSYVDRSIPTWSELQNKYEMRWKQEKEKFQQQLKANFFALTERFASSKQEIFVLATPERREKLYIDAFLELFESGYAPHIGDPERIANKRCRRLFVTFPINHLA